MYLLAVPLYFSLLKSFLTHRYNLSTLNHLYPKHAFHELLSHPFRDTYYFSISWAFSTPPDPWLGLHWIRMGVQDRKAAYLIVGHWHWPGLGCHHIPLAPCKIHSSSFCVIPVTLLPASIQVTPQIIFPPRLNLPEAHTVSPYPSALPPKYTLVFGQKQSHRWVCLYGRRNPHQLPQPNTPRRWSCAAFTLCPFHLLSLLIILLIMSCRKA